MSEIKIVFVSVRIQVYACTCTSSYASELYWIYLDLVVHVATEKADIYIDN